MSGPDTSPPRKHLVRLFLIVCHESESHSRQSNFTVWSIRTRRRFSFIRPSSSSILLYSFKFPSSFFFPSSFLPVFARHQVLSHRTRRRHGCSIVSYPSIPDSTVTCHLRYLFLSKENIVVWRLIFSTFHPARIRTPLDIPQYSTYAYQYQLRACFHHPRFLLYTFAFPFISSFWLS